MICRQTERYPRHTNKQSPIINHHWASNHTTTLLHHSCHWVVPTAAAANWRRQVCGCEIIHCWDCQPTQSHCSTFPAAGDSEISATAPGCLTKDQLKQWVISIPSNWDSVCFHGDCCANVMDFGTFQDLLWGSTGRTVSLPIQIRSQNGWFDFQIHSNWTSVHPLMRHAQMQWMR